MINKAFNRRTKGDYDVFVEFESKEVVEMFDEMQQFIERITHYLNSK